MNYENFEAYEIHPEIAHEFAHEMYENELAQELMEIQNEEELDQFLSKLVGTAWRGVKGFYNSPQGQALKNQVISGAKAIGKKALPALGKAIGGHVGGDLGAQCGNQIGNWASGKVFNEFEFETGGNTNDADQARRLVRMVRQSSARIATAAQGGQAINRQSVRGILMQSARQNFPEWNFTSAVGSGGSSIPSSGLGGPNASGTWYRQGNQIVIVGA